MPSDPRKMNFILIGLCTKGEISYRMDTEELVVHAGEMLVVSERHVIDGYKRSDDMEGLCIMMSVDFFHEIIKNVRDVNSLFIFSRSHPVIGLTTKEQETFKEYFHVIKHKIGDQDNFFRKDLIRTLLLAMFYDVGNIIYRFKETDKPQTRAEAILTKYIKMVEANFRQERRVGWYAQQLCITPKYLSEMVKAASNKTPNEWIDNYVTMELRVLLKNSSKSIKAITEEMNFPNQSFLGKYFKEHVGMSPSKYRKL
jgi:AraC-like DNA-binding protein